MKAWLVSETYQWEDGESVRYLQVEFESGEKRLLDVSEEMCFYQMERRRGVGTIGTWHREESFEDFIAQAEPPPDEDFIEENKRLGEQQIYAGTDRAIFDADQEQFGRQSWEN